MILFGKVVLVEQSSSKSRNDDKKAWANSPLNLYRAHCSMPRMSFHDGSRPGTVSENINFPGLGGGVASNESWTGIWEKSLELLSVHAA